MQHINKIQAKIFGSDEISLKIVKKKKKCIKKCNVHTIKMLAKNV